ncbi:hypothetical protein KSA82_20940, partial [Acinetobacter baumannii]|nr:hypothetical protein [Acinetobacter baumannii]
NTLKIKASSEYSEEEKASRLKALKAQYDYDLAEFKKNEKRKRDEAWATIQAISGALEEARVNAVSKASLSPLMQSRFDLNSAQQSGYSQIGDNLNNGLNAINENEYLDEQQKYSERLALFEQFLAARKALNEQYSEEDRDLQEQINAATLAGYGAMFGIMSSMLDNFGAKSSTAYKVAFASQKAFVLASALLNAKGAVMAA